MSNKSTIHVLTVITPGMYNLPNLENIFTTEADYFNSIMVPHLNRVILAPCSTGLNESGVNAFLTKLRTSTGYVQRVSNQSRIRKYTPGEYTSTLIYGLHEAFRFDVIRIYTLDDKIPELWLDFQATYPQVKIVLGVSEIEIETSDIHTPKSRRYLTQLQQSVRRLKCLIQKYL